MIPAFPENRIRRLAALSVAGLAVALLAACNDSIIEPDPVAPVAADTARNVFAGLPSSAAVTVADLHAEISVFSIRSVTDLRADSVDPAFTYFSLASGRAVADSNAAWDLAFRGTTVKVRGASQLIAADFVVLTEAPETGYVPGNAPAWYDYSGAPNHLITPKAGQVLVVKTHDDKYAKIEFQGYYKGNPETPDGLADTSKYYAFRYAYQTDGSRDLDATTGSAPKTYFSLQSGRQVDSASSWDIAFRTTGITVNGGAQLVSADFDSLTVAPATGYEATVGAWYDYSGAPDHLITPKANTVLVVKTADGKYAKIQILSYYKGNPENPDGLADTSKYYTFRYFLQADGSTSLNAGGDAAPRTFFSLRTGETATDSTADWDIAFRTTTITVNGSALLLTGSNFDALTEVPADGYSSGTLPSWYDYNLDGNHTITPKVGAVIALRTTDGKYAKIQILSYYQDAPAVPLGTRDEARYYTFRYVLQEDGSRTFAGAAP